MKAPAKALNVQAWQEKIRATNKAFKKLSRAEKRVAIAKDVLAALAAKRFLVSTGRYVGLPFDEAEALDDHPLEPFAPSSACEVCAKGALFVAKVDRLNKLSNGDDIHGDPSDHLADLFSREQLDLIECAFERSSMFGDAEGLQTDAGEKLVYSAVRFASRKSGRGRLKAIMENIIENKGTFRPGKLPKKKAVGP